MTRLALVILIALWGCSNWTHKDTVLETAFIAVTAIDWEQTETITHNCGELNPAIGRCGDVIPVNLYFPVVIAAHIAIAAVLPPGWCRAAFQGITFGVEATTTYWNHSARELR
ncbi:MAG: hypothetical protein JWO36_1838 [Myxococcales bacterium]|nr:hypothetical protein [Myxococcales bacterium]